MDFFGLIHRGFVMYLMSSRRGTDVVSRWNHRSCMSDVGILGAGMIYHRLCMKWWGISLMGSHLAQVTTHCIDSGSHCLTTFIHWQLSTALGGQVWRWRLDTVARLPGYCCAASGFKWCCQDNRAILYIRVHFCTMGGCCPSLYFSVHDDALLLHTDPDCKNFERDKN